MACLLNAVFGTVDIVTRRRLQIATIKELPTLELPLQLSAIALIAENRIG